MAVPTQPIWRLTVTQYHQMICAGILTEDDPVELLEGWLVTKMPKNPPHTVSTQATGDVLARIVSDGWFVNRQEPITTDDSEPEPDVTVVRGDRRNYRERHPGPNDVGLLVEVAAASLERDRGPKKRLYASAGIPIYWIVNLVEHQVEVYADASAAAGEPDYRSRRVYLPDDRVPVILDGCEVGAISAGDILS